MNLRLALLRIHLPARLRARGLGELAAAVSSATGTGAPDLSACRHGDALGRFAEFVREASESRRAAGGPGDGPAAEADARLERAAFAIGRRLRAELGVATRRDAFAALAILYRAIGIDWRTAPDGAVRVRRCAFARRFDPAACAFASSLDRGIVEGLTAGGRLRFEERLTEGRPACLARIDFAEADR